MLIATWFHGAFALKQWGPIAVLALILVAAAAATGGIRPSRGPERAALACGWAFAGWTVVSATWAESPARALEGGGRTLLYVALVTLALAIASPRQARYVSGAVIAGIGVIATVTLIQLASDGSTLFLAGRLDDPVGYRNATACLFALAFWPFVAVAARRQMNSLVRGAAFGAATLALGLAFLTQSRGVVLGLALGGAVAIGLGPDRLRRAWFAILAAGGIALLSDRLLEPFRGFSDRGGASPADIATATDALMLLTVIATFVGIFATLLDGGLRLEGRARESARRVAVGGLTVTVIAAAVITLVRIGDPVEFVDKRVDEFRGLEAAAPGETRLTFGGGQRSDLWRVSLLELRDRPLTGVGEGSYPVRYYVERRTDRNLSTPHSLAFSVLAELGAVGALLLAGLFGALALALRSRWRTGPPGARWWASALGAAGAVAVGQAMVDWMWLIPGVMGLGLLCLALAAASLRPELATDRGGGRPATRAIAAAALALAAVGVSAVYLSDVQVRQARGRDAEPARKRLDTARTAERLNPWSVPPRYLQAGALEELGRVAEARSELHGALELEPRNFVTLGLLGDLELRAGNLPAARSYYRRALALNPRDVGLRKLARRDAG